MIQGWRERDEIRRLMKGNGLQQSWDPSLIVTGGKMGCGSRLKV